MGSIRERQTAKGEMRFHAQVRLKGVATQTASFERKTDARRWIQDTESAIRQGRHFKSVEAKRHTLGEMVQRYEATILPLKPKSLVGQGGQLGWWRTHFGDRLLADMTPAVIAEARDLLRKEPGRHGQLRTPATINRYLAVLSHAFTIAVKEWGWTETNPVRMVRRLPEPQGRVRFLSDDERSRLLEACRESSSAALYPVVVLALATGMRQGEIMGLQWADVDLLRGWITLHDTKNRDRRGVPLTGHALDQVREWARIRRLGSNWVFPGKTGDSPIDLRSPWISAVKRAGIEDFRFHDLRHSAASYLAMNGATPSELAAVLGHKTLQMVKRYAHLSDDHTAEIVGRMNAKIFGDTA